MGRNLCEVCRTAIFTGASGLGTVAVGAVCKNVRGGGRVVGGSDGD